jgi:hypothetical protein
VDEGEEGEEDGAVEGSFEKYICDCGCFGFIFNAHLTTG